MEISTDLREKGFQEEIVETTVGELVERGWLDDEALARSMIVRGQAVRKSWPRIFADLRKRGIERNLAEECLRSTYDPEKELQSVRYYVRRGLMSCPSTPDHHDIERLAQRISRRGYRASTIAKALREETSCTLQ